MDKKIEIEVVSMGEAADRIDRAVEHGGGAIVVCGRAEPGWNQEGLTFTTCADCGVEISYGVNVPANAKKVCGDCAMMNYPMPNGVMISEETMQSALKMLGLPDLPQTRRVVQRIASEGYNARRQALMNKKQQPSEGGSAWE